MERNALSAGLVERAEDWRWGSLWAREAGLEPLRQILCDWPVDRPGDWKQYVNEAIAPKELARLRLSKRREQPYGDEAWVERTVKRLGLEHTIRPEGRPRVRGPEQQKHR